MDISFKEEGSHSNLEIGAVNLDNYSNTIPVSSAAPEWFQFSTH